MMEYMGPHGVSCRKQLENGKKYVELFSDIRQHTRQGRRPREKGSKLSPVTATSLLRGTLPSVTQVADPQWSRSQWAEEVETEVWADWAGWKLKDRLPDKVELCRKRKEGCAETALRPRLNAKPGMHGARRHLPSHQAEWKVLAEQPGKSMEIPEVLVEVNQPE